MQVAHALRDARPKRRVAKPRGRSAAIAAPVQRLAAAGLAGTFAGWTALALPFFPAGWWLGLGALAAASAYARERIGLAVALAVPVLPLGNVSLGLALLYAAVAVVWLAAAWREPRTGLLAALGPLLGPLSALGLLPLTATSVRSPLRRAVQTATAVLLAALAAGFRHAPLPFTGAAPPRGLGVAGANDPLDVAGSLLRALGDHPALLIEASALALVTALLPYARARGRWGAAGLAGLLLAGTVLAVPSASALPLVLAAWLTWAALTLRSRAAT